MQIYQFTRKGEMPVRLDSVSRLPREGFIWIDYTRSEAGNWSADVEPLAESTIYENHVNDSMNPQHPSFFDVTENYDMLIFQGLTPVDCNKEEHLIVTRSAAFFIFDRLLVTVRAEENVSFDIIKKKFCETKLRFPSTPVGLVYSILDTMVDRYLTITDELEKRLERVQALLIDPMSDFDDWRVLLAYRKQAHDLEVLCEHNLDAIDAWKREMRVEITEKQRTRLNDLREHIQRVQAHSDGVQKDIEVAVQLHFASVSHQTNRVMRSLTVMSAIFFPLTLITGIYGMNFRNMPELEWKDGYYFVLSVLTFIGVGLYFVFKRRRYL